MEPALPIEQFLSVELFQQDFDRMAMVLNWVNTPVMILDAQGQIIYCNLSCHQVIGYSFTEVSERPFWDFLWFTEEKTALQQVLATPQPDQFPFEHESNWRQKNGDRCRITWSFLALLDRSRSILYVVVTGMNITSGNIAEQRHLEAIASELEEIYPHPQLNEEFVDQAQTSTAQLQQALHLETTLKRITDKVRDSLDESQILQAAVQELGTALGVECCDTGIFDANYTTSTIRYEYTLLPSAQGQSLKIADSAPIYSRLLQGQHLQFCYVTSAPIRNIAKRFAILACPILDDQGVLGDLWLLRSSELMFNELETRLVQQVANQCAIAMRQARLYQKAQVQLEELEKLNTLKDEFLSAVSHELRTPVSNMKMAIQMLGIALNQNRPFLTELAKPKSEQSRIARYFQVLQEECEREISLINDLLDLQRLEAEVQPIVLELIQLTGWLPTLLAPFQERSRSRQQQMEIDLPSDLPPLRTSPNSLRRILVELLDNACKYTPAQERIDVQVWATAVQMYFRVTNSGIVIPADQLPLIFNKFHRVPTADPWRQGGTGLGLALAKKLTEHLGGTIAVTSADHHTCFTLELPLLLPDPIPAA